MTSWMCLRSPSNWANLGRACETCSPCASYGRPLNVWVKRDGEAVHLAARWAGKEAFLKAWCEAISRRANADGDIAYLYTLDDFPWARIEILDDSHGVPHVMLAPEVRRKLQQSLGLPVDGDDQSFEIHISISHDGAVASAVVTIEA